MINSLKPKLRLLRSNLEAIVDSFSCCSALKTNKNVCWLIGTPDHKNLGDHAIAYASLLFIKKVLPELTIYEIDEGSFYKEFYFMKRNIKKGDIIVLQGGGNLGNQYLYIEDMRRMVIAHFKSFPIIMFPQTIFFTKDRIGNVEQSITERIYNNNSNLSLVAREKFSFQIMKKLFHCNSVICSPDIVLSLHDTHRFNCDRDGIILCMRNDNEGIIPKDAQDRLLALLQSISKVTQIDTISHEMISKEKREEELIKLLGLFSESKLVVTDRLHGMVFAAITDTPCIVFSNYNHKVKGVYEWIKMTNMVFYCDNPDKLGVNDIYAAYEAMPNSRGWTIINNGFENLSLFVREKYLNDKN